MSRKKALLLFVVLALVALAAYLFSHRSRQSAPAPAAGANPTVGGAAMDATKTIVDNAAAAPNLTTLVSAVKAADLATTLAGSGPFTVFAPTNEAFGRLAPGTVETLMKPEQKANLAKVLKYHVVPGTLTIDDNMSRCPVRVTTGSRSSATFSARGN